VRRSGILAGALLPGILIGMGTASAQDKPPVDVSTIARVEPAITIPSLTYYPDSPMGIEVILRNPARVPVTVPGSCLAESAFTLRTMGESDVHRPSGRLEKRAEMTIPPMGEQVLEVDLRKMYKVLRKPGGYRLMWECGEWRSSDYRFMVVEPYDRDRDRVAVVTTDLGTLEMVLMPEQAPNHVRSFVDLARGRYYDGVPFYRIVPGVQADTGDPRGDGTGGWDQQMPGEIDDRIFPGKGLVGATRRDTSMTSASLFFILLNPAPTFAGKQTFFAYVRKGEDVLDALAAIEVPNAEQGIFRPAKPVRILGIQIREK